MALPGSSKPATLKDIARMAGVSAMTVSNALNNRYGVSEKTKKRVCEVANQLKYTPNQVAQSLRSAKTQTIGVVMSDSSQYVFSQLLRGIEHAATKVGYSILLANTDQKRAAESKAIDLLVSKRIDGLLLVAPLSTEPEDIARIQAMNVPFVFLMRTPSVPMVDYVTNDNYMGGYLGAGHLCRTRVNNVVFLALDSASGRDRMRGQAQCLRDNGLDISDCPVEWISPQIEEGYSAMKRILGKGYKKGTICCGCDIVAVGAIEAILENGFTIPHDFQLIGYDDFDMAPYLRTPLTTVRQPVYQIGEEGFGVLINRIDDPDSPYQSIILQPELIVRKSTV